MAFVISAITRLLAHASFFLFILVQWIRDASRKTIARPDIDSEVGVKCEIKRPYVVGSQIAQKRDRSNVLADQMSTITERSWGRGSRRDEYERVAHERIVESFRPDNRAKREEWIFSEHNQPSGGERAVPLWHRPNHADKLSFDAFGWEHLRNTRFFCSGIHAGPKDRNPH